jgi:hypothetical protein
VTTSKIIRGLTEQVYSTFKYKKRGRGETTRGYERRDMPFKREESRTTGDRWFNLALNVQVYLVMDKSERL